jgi:hypothetical protein
VAEVRSDSVEMGVARERRRVFIEAHQESRLMVVLEASQSRAYERTQAATQMEGVDLQGCGARK